MPASIPAGTAIAVPKPAMPSRKPPKPQPIKRIKTRLSWLTLVNMSLIVSIAFVCNVKL